MLGGAPEAHEVLSKTPRFDPIAPLQKSVEAFPIKASDHPPVMAPEAPESCGVHQASWNTREPTASDGLR